MLLALLAVADYLYIRRHKKEIVERLLWREGFEESRSRQSTDLHAEVAGLEEAKRKDG